MEKHMLLRMPPGLRRQVLQYAQSITTNKSTRHPFPRRTFFNGSRLSRQGQATSPKKPQPPPPRAQPPPVNAANPKVAPSYIESLLQGNEQVLLYVSPKHNALFASSYLIGGAFLFGAYSWAQFALKEGPAQAGQAAGPSTKQPWFVKAALTAEILVVVALGTHFILAPSKLVKSITLVKAAASTTTTAATTATMPAAPPFLRLEVKRALPFLKPDVLETPQARVFLDRDVRTAGEDIRIVDVPRAEAQQFTSSYFAGVDVAASGEPRVGFVRSVWPTIRRETRRMFLRDKMAYLRTLDNGRFKLDLQGAALLDGARALDRVIGKDHEKRVGVLGFIRGVIST